MCLIIQKPANVNFSDEFLKGVYSLNPDGIGVMYAENDVLYHAKHVPSNFQEFKLFWDTHCATRKSVMHARWKTHGDIDMDNCHPYEVISADEGYPLYLMHNGVLHTGNHKDKSKSDTWHFIQDYLRPMLLKNPEFFMTRAFENLIGDYIGTGNKFVLLDAYGNQVTINEQEFVEYNGALLSNTYAWDTTGTEHDTSRWTNYLKGGNSQAKNAGTSYNNAYGYDSSFALGDRTPYEETDMDVWCEAVFDQLQSAGMNTAYKKISYRDLENYYQLVGEKNAWEIENLIEYGCWSDDEFIAEIRMEPYGESGVVIEGVSTQTEVGR